MSFSAGVRQFHRWMSVVFTGLVVVVFLSAAQAAAPEWLFYLPLPPLALMLISGLHLFVLPYLRRRGG